MQLRVRFLAALVGSLVGPPLLSGQDVVHTYEQPLLPADTLLHRNILSMLFDRNLNTYNWIGRLVLDTAAGGNRIALDQQYISNIIVSDPGTLPGGRRLRNDQENISLLLSRPLSTELNVRTQWSSLVSYDNRGVGLSYASSHSLLAGIGYSPLMPLTITPMVGYRWDNQVGIRDRGPSINLAGVVQGINLEGYQLTGAGQFRRDLLDPRILETDFARTSVQRSFSGRTRDSLELGLIRTRREFYTLADSTIESRIDNFLTFTNLLEYELGPTILSSFYVAIAGRGLDKNLRTFGTLAPAQPQFDTRIDEFHLDAYVQAAYRSDDGATAASIRLFHSERDETHVTKPIVGASNNIQLLFAERSRQEQSKDNLAKRTALSGVVELPLSLSDRIAAAAWVSILRYDTPSDLNVEDRDELLITASIGTTHRISRYVDLALGLDGTLSHLVYLLSARSANNNINRVLRLAPRVTCRPFSSVTTHNAFEVLANYTVYDFENELARIRSYSYRQFGWLDSTVVMLTDRIGLDFFVYLKLYERGQLKWSEFSERTESSFTDKTYSVQVHVTPDPRTMFAVGLRYFSQARYAYGTTGKTLDSFLSSIGPTCVIQHEFGTQSAVNFRGWYERRKQPDGTSRTLASMTLNLLFSF
jgi:hypothetical protein